ncbi:NAD(P)H-dependent oxidoreductase [Hyphococcus luteus]|uniref:NAD(P)H dehydrogenase n=1 Tax=Hyphococcus luteus TaxID=2058213 RepID=A0A2S7K8G0_9PROT|nr:NAD(P)H-dependent oxidoreductase [Marinicaulis flavus]PQA88794.1 NAD(P)H dehydrogenase [Marinicaulis flavus]
MPETLILLFHPDLSRSRANAALAQAAAKLDSVSVIDMYGVYPDGRIDSDAETARILGADRLVFQFPVQWYSTPPLLKAWQDAVLTRMFYIRYEEEGAKLEGMPMLVAATAGNTPKAYTARGANLFPLAKLLRPLEATAHRCGLPYAKPFLLYEADKFDDAALDRAGRNYVKKLAQWRRRITRSARSFCAA